MADSFTKNHLIYALVALIVGAGGSSAVGFSPLFGGSAKSHLQKQIDDLGIKVADERKSITQSLSKLTVTIEQSQEHDRAFRREVRERLSKVSNRLGAVECEALLARGEKCPLGPGVR